MRRSPFTVLVCLLFFLISVQAVRADKYLDVVVQHPQGEEGTSVLSPGEPTDETPSFIPASVRPFYGGSSRFPKVSHRPITKCKPALCVPSVPCMPMAKPGCKLPKRMLGQWELSTQVFFARVGGKVSQGAYAGGIIPPTDIDINDDLGIPSSGVFLEYHARYQFAPTWALYYSIMPIQLEANKTLERNLYYGQWLLPAGSRVHTKWDFQYQRVGLLFQPIVSCNAAVSVFGGWTYNEHTTEVFNYVCHGHWSKVTRSRHMVNSGIEIQKCILTKCSGATLSCDHRVGVNFFDGTFGWDIEAGIRYSVPLGAGRWGYARGGYRYLNLSENRDDMRLDATLDGGFVEAGIIF